MNRSTFALPRRQLSTFDLASLAPTDPPDSTFAARPNRRFDRLADARRPAGVRVGALRKARRHERARELGSSDAIEWPMNVVDRTPARQVEKLRRTVAVSIVSHGHGEDVLDLLRDLAQHARASVARIVLTLNLPEPALEQAAAAACAGIELTIRRNARPLGFGTNHNAAFRDRGSVRHFAVLNPDVRLRADPFPELCEALLGEPRAACAYPMQTDAAGRPCNPPRPVPTPLSLLRRYLGRQEGHRLDWVNAACMLFEAEAFARLGGFDTRYRLYCEDVDICLRLQLAGYDLIGATQTCIMHGGRRSSHARLSHLLMHVRSLLRLWGSGALWRYRRGVRRSPRAL